MFSPAANPDDLLQRVEELSARVDELPDPRARELAHELVGTVIAMYGDGLRRVVETIWESRLAGEAIMEQLAGDGAVASLLLIHDLYPVSLEDRVVEALDTVRPYMESHGGNVELVGIEDGVARLALQGSCNGCAASRATLETAIKQAIDEHAPDLRGLEVTGITDPGRDPHGRSGEPSPFELPVIQAGAPGPIELPMVHAGAPEPAPGRAARWVALDGEAGPEPGQLRTRSLDGVELLLANVGGSLLAYRDECAACGASLAAGELDGGMLRCASCSVEFDLPRAGRAAGGEPLQLAPVPLLQEGGTRVAV